MYNLQTKPRWQDIDQDFLLTETKSRSIKTQKRARSISSHLDRTSLVNKGLITWPKDYAKELRFCEDKAGDPEWTR